jgi:hypothetical protein
LAHFLLPYEPDQSDNTDNQQDSSYGDSYDPCIALVFASITLLIQLIVLLAIALILKRTENKICGFITGEATNRRTSVTAPEF